MFFIMYRFGKNLKVWWHNLLVNGVGEWLPGGPVVMNPPYNDGDVGSTPGWGTKIPQEATKIPHAATKTQCRQIDR